MRTISWIQLISVCILFLCCAQNSGQKIDPALKRIIKTDNNSDEQIQIMGKFNNITKEELKKEIIAAGGTPGTITDDIFSATIPKSVIKTLSKKKFIQYLELSKQKNLR